MRIATIQQYAVFTRYLALFSFESFHIALVRVSERCSPLESRQTTCCPTSSAFHYLIEEPVDWRRMLCLHSLIPPDITIRISRTSRQRMRTQCDCQPLTLVDKVNLDHAYWKISEPAEDPQNSERPVLKDKLKRKIKSLQLIIYDGLRQSNKPWQIISMNIWRCWKYASKIWYNPTFSLQRY